MYDRFVEKELSLFVVLDYDLYFLTTIAEAWADQGMTQTILESNIKAVVKKLTARRRMQKFRQRKSMKV